MNYPSTILIDSSILFAYYSLRDTYHQPVKRFFERYTGELVTTVSCVTEVMYLLGEDWQTQNEFLSDLSIELYRCVPLIPRDFNRIAELNEKYADLPADFADLSLIVISERLEINAIVTLDRDFDIYRRYRDRPFERVFLPE